ncbi:NADH-quinone oxidoreductase subunit L [Modicisalibacter xianhensis]|uniref:NADH:ubiquinone oxidoreductase subunit 5 (Chain L)/Multisubunit Na+/H+ antiporter, MnhA subunit n=1 Tax=Modicisalibacter xianhensis TaxID=442341 RepID=A0A1I3EWM4_9GAMM|nr:proton-conducting transporter membrane subunit [Halomonas xianhensis]SFI03389.1 NADH:ubiquinone oxidoreductase subunit 5 (chain L)/Multisubunit Na+/H+ antiporter, MnhA subunit [Halomonas xianhensis]
MMLWLVPLVPLLLAPALYLSGRRLGQAGLVALAASGLLVTLAMAGLAEAAGGASRYAWSETLTLGLAMSPAGRVAALLVPLIALPVVIYAGAGSGARLLALLVAFVGAMQLLILADDLLTLLIAWELIGACSWALISHRWEKPHVPRDAATAFLVTRFGDLGLYIAAGAVFAGSGGFGYDDLAQLQGGLKHVAVAGLLLAAAAKSAQVPFSAWLFAAMSGPVPVSALLHAATLVSAGLYLIARLEPALSDVAWFAPVTVVIGLATALAGGIVATCQDHAKKLLAASTSAQYGLMWVAVGAGFPGVALLYFVAHAFMKAGLFLSAGEAERQAGTFDLTHMRLGRRLPGVAVMALILSLALAGVAPLGAAWAKEQVVAAAYHQAVVLALLVSLAGGLSALYATRFQRLAFGRPPHSLTPGLPEAPGPSVPATLSLGALVVGTLILSVLWWPELHRSIVESLTFSLPPGHLWLLIVSLLLVAAGIAIGIWMTRPGQTLPAQLEAKRPMAAQWFGLSAATAALAGWTSVLGHRLARFDDEVVDAGLRATARAGEWLARLGAGRGEWLGESLPGSLTRLSEWGGRWARQAQSGQTHHYYTGIAVGCGVILVLLWIGALL